MVLCIAVASNGSKNCEQRPFAKQFLIQLLFNLPASNFTVFIGSISCPSVASTSATASSDDIKLLSNTYPLPLRCASGPRQSQHYSGL